MLKKLFYVGLGISIIVVKKSVSYLLEKREQAGEAFTADSTVDEVVAVDDAMAVDEVVADEVVADQTEAAVPVVSAPEDSIAVSKADELTEINGIGPTYAKRLRAAGIMTYAELAATSPDELHVIAKATGKSTDVESWIAQAGSLA